MLAVRGDIGFSVFDASTTLTIGTNEWYHIAATGDGTNVDIYINGVKSATTGVNTLSTGDSTDTPRIGANTSTAGREWNGRMADVRIYNRALTANEIAFDYANFLAPFRLKPLTIATSDAAPPAGGGGIQNPLAGPMTLKTPLGAA